MASIDPISAEPDDEAVAQRLRAFFSMASAQQPMQQPGPPPAAGTLIPAPPAPSTPTPADLDTRPPPTGPPVFDPEATEPATPDAATVQDVAGLVRYLDARLELTRRRTAEHLDRVFATLDARLGAIEGRLGDPDQAHAADAALAETLVAFRNELFAWLEGYVGWEASRLAELDQRLPGGPAGPPGP